MKQLIVAIIFFARIARADSPPDLPAAPPPVVVQGSLVRFEPTEPTQTFWVTTLANARAQTCRAPCTLRLLSGPAHVSISGDAHFERDVIVPATDSRARIDPFSPTAPIVAGVLSLLLTGPLFLALGLGTPPSTVASLEITAGIAFFAFGVTEIVIAIVRRSTINIVPIEHAAIRSRRRFALEPLGLGFTF